MRIFNSDVLEDIYRKGTCDETPQNDGDGKKDFSRGWKNHMFVGECGGVDNRPGRKGTKKGPSKSKRY